MDVQASLVADAEPPVLMHPGQRSFRRPPGLTQPRVVETFLRQHRLDPDLPQPLAVGFAVVGQVPLQSIGLGARMSDLPRYRRQLVDQRAISRMSLWLAAVAEPTSGRPLASVRTWCLVPGLPRSTGLLPVPSPP